MKKSNFTGWKDVFGFTFIQSVKSKGSIIFTAIIFAIAAFLVPVMSVFNDGDDEVKKSPIESVYIYNETDIDITSSMKQLYKETEFEDIEYKIIDDLKDTEEKLDSDKKYEKAAIMVFSLDSEMGCYTVQLEYSENGKLDEGDMEDLSYSINEKFSKIMSLSLGITDEQMEFVNKTVVTDVFEYTGEKEDTDEEKEVFNGVQYGVLLAVICMMAFVISFMGESVATAIITEKSSKIIEFLLTSIKPMAIVIGKVFAVISYILMEIIIIFIGVMISFVIRSEIKGETIKESINKTINILAESDASLNIDFINMIIALFTILLGLTLYGMIAGLVGATVNKLEESAEGLKVYSFAMVIGAYITLAVAMTGMGAGVNDIVVKAVCVFPLSAPFALSGFTLIGMIDMSTIIISIVILLVCIVLITMFTANVYEEVIYHNGERLKIKDIIRIYKNNKRGQ